MPYDPTGPAEPAPIISQFSSVTPVRPPAIPISHGELLGTSIMQFSSVTFEAVIWTPPVMTSPLTTSPAVDSVSAPLCVVRFVPACTPVVAASGQSDGSATLVPPLPSLLKVQPDPK